MDMLDMLDTLRILTYQCGKVIHRYILAKPGIQYLSIGGIRVCSLHHELCAVLNIHQIPGLGAVPIDVQHILVLVPLDEYGDHATFSG